jgi:chemotaxis protein MotB
MNHAGRRPIPAPWAITFADMALLLLCFFVMLTSLNQTARTPTAATPVALPAAPPREMAALLQREFAAGIAEGWLSVRAGDNTLRVDFGTSDGFESGSDLLAPRTLSLIGAIGTVLATNQAHIVVSGHTDNLPVRTTRFRDNWDLSSARAVSVIRELIGRSRIDPDRLEAKGYADTRPLAGNDSQAGRARNRRIEMEIRWPR